MKTTKIGTTILVTMLLLSFPMILVRAQPQTHNADSMWVEPPSTVFDTTNASIGTKFNVTIWLNMSENIYAYQIGLHYNRTQLQCTRADLTGGTTSNYFKGHTTVPAGPTIDTGSLANGSVLAGESCLGNDFITGPKNASLIWAEFQILIVSSSGNFTSKLDISTEYLSNTYVLDTDLNNIDITPYDGSYLFTGTTITPPSLTVSISANSTSIYVGDSVFFTSTVSGGGPPYDYKWFLNLTLVPGVTSNSWTYTPAEAGSGMVYLNVTDSNATRAESNTLFITVLPPLTGAEIYVDPPQILDLSMGPGSTFSINITVANVASLGGCSFNLTYDPHVLNWIGFDFLPAGGEYPTAVIMGNTSAGFTWMMLTYSTPITALSVPLTRLRFFVNSYGISPLSLTDTELLDQNGNPITHNEFGGTFASVIPDVAIINVVTSGNSTYQGGIINITVTASNLGQVTESFNVTAFYDANLLGTVPIINLAPNATISQVFTLNTTGLMLYHNYTISAQASIVPYEINTANNAFVDGNIIVKILGDVNGDGKVDIRDISLIAKAFGTVGPDYLYPGSPPSPNWNPDADLNGDNRIDIRDISIAARNFGKAYP
jgi:hypothetical protein